MKIRYLGTAAAEAIPALFCKCSLCRRAYEKGGRDVRSRSQAVIDDRLLVDFPPDSYMHMAAGHVFLPDIQSLIVTHAHSDHFYPLDLMQRDEPFAHGLSPEPLHIYGGAAPQALYYAARSEFAHNRSPVTTDYTYVEPLKSFLVDGYTVTALPANHDKRQDCYIYLVEKNGKRLLYANDTGLFAPEVWQFISPLRFDLVSMDCTMGLIPDGSYHMGLGSNFKMREQLLETHCADDNTRFVITHFSHNGGLLHEELCEKVRALGIAVAYDGMEVEF